MNFGKSGRFENDDWFQDEDELGRSRNYDDKRMSRQTRRDTDDNYGDESFGFEWLSSLDNQNALKTDGKLDKSQDYGQYRKSQTGNQLRDSRKVYTGPEQSPYRHSVTPGYGHVGKKEDEKPTKKLLSTIAESGIYDGPDGLFKLQDEPTSHKGFSSFGNMDLGQSRNYGYYHENGSCNQSSRSEEDDMALPKTDWRDRILSSETKDFFQNQWKRVPVRASFKQGSSAFGNYRYSIDDTLRNPKEKDPGVSCSGTNCNLFGIFLIIFSLLAAVGVGLTVVLVIVLPKAQPMSASTTVGTTQLPMTVGVVEMNMTINDTLTEQLNNKNSSERQQYETDFCNMMRDIYTDNSSSIKDQYSECVVDSISNGSIIIIFRITITGDITGISNSTFISIAVQVLGNDTGTVQREQFNIIVETIVVLSFTTTIPSTSPATTTTTTSSTTETPATTTTTMSSTTETPATTTTTTSSTTESSPTTTTTTTSSTTETPATATTTTPSTTETPATNTTTMSSTTETPATTTTTTSSITETPATTTTTWTSSTTEKSPTIPTTSTSQTTETSPITTTTSTLSTTKSSPSSTSTTMSSTTETSPSTLTTTSTTTSPTFESPSTTTTSATTETSSTTITTTMSSTTETFPTTTSATTSPTSESPATTTTTTSATTETSPNTSTAMTSSTSETSSTTVTTTMSSTTETSSTTSTTTSPTSEFPATTTSTTSATTETSPTTSTAPTSSTITTTISSPTETFNTTSTTMSPTNETSNTTSTTSPITDTAPTTTTTSSTTETSLPTTPTFPTTETSNTTSTTTSPTSETSNTISTTTSPTTETSPTTTSTTTSPTTEISSTTTSTTTSPTTETSPTTTSTTTSPTTETSTTTSTTTETSNTTSTTTSPTTETSTTTSTTTETSPATTSTTTSPTTETSTTTSPTTEISSTTTSTTTSPTTETSPTTTSTTTSPTTETSTTTSTTTETSPATTSTTTSTTTETSNTTSTTTSPTTETSTTTSTTTETSPATTSTTTSPTTETSTTTSPTTETSPTTTTTETSNTTSTTTSSTTETTTTSPTTTTTTALITALVIDDRTAVIYESVEMACVVYYPPDDWTWLSISSDAKGVIANLSKNSNVMELFPGQFETKTTIADNEMSINVTLNSISSNCMESGIFTCQFQSPGRGQFIETANLFITAYPSSIQITPQNLYNEGQEGTVTCSGNLPSETGNLDLYIRSLGESSFSKYDESTPAVSEEALSSNCTKYTTKVYSFTPNLPFNGTEVKCVSSNSALSGSKQESLTELIIITESDIAFNEYNRREEISANGISIICIARAAVGWNTIEVFRRTTGSTTDVAIFSLNEGSSPTNQSLSARASYIYTEDDNSVSVNITLSVLQCEDRGTYTCNVTGTSTPLSTTTTFDIYRNPGIPTLTLHPDQITDLGFHRGGFEHTCRSEVGFPPGNISVVYQKQGQTGFIPFENNRIIQYPTNTTSTSCGTTKFFRFGLNFTDEDDGAEVKCIVENEDLEMTTESATGILELIPRQYCNITGYPKNRYHPTSCNKYVQCDSKYPYGNECPSTECVTAVDNNAHCGSCDGVICPENFTTTTQSSTTTTPLPPTSAFIDCFDESIFIGEPVSIECNVTGSFEYINVTNEESTSRAIADILPDGTVVYRDKKEGEDVTYTSTTSLLVISYDNTSCEDKGRFDVTLKPTGAEAETQSVTLNVKNKPHSVSLFLHADVVEGIDRKDSEHICEGFVGFPGGQLEIRLKKFGSSEYETLTETEFRKRESHSSFVEENCNNKEILSFGLKPQMDWNNGSIICIATNNNILQDGDSVKNDSSLLEVIPGGYCTGKADNTYLVHPGSCHKYVVCSKEYPFGKTCNDSCYTSRSELPLCGDCSTLSCHLISTTTTTTTQATTTPLPDIYSTCIDVSGKIGSSVNVVCNVTENTYNYINVTFASSSSGSTTNVADIIPGTGVTNDKTSTEKTITVSNDYRQISVSIHALSCSDTGHYLLEVVSGNQTAKTTVAVNVRAAPNMQPILTSEPYVVSSRDLSPTIKCNGTTGFPSDTGTIDLQIKYPGNNTFVDVTELTKAEKSSAEDNCMFTKMYEFSGTATTSMNGSIIRCATSHTDLNTDLFSSGSPLLVVDGTLCSGTATGDFLNHPYDCQHYIQCSHEVVYTKSCSGNTCWNVSTCISSCDHCLN